MEQRASGGKPSGSGPGLAAVRQAFRSRWMSSASSPLEASAALGPQEIEYRHWVSAWMKSFGALDVEQAGPPPPLGEIEIVRLQRPAEGMDAAVWLLTTEDGPRDLIRAPHAPQPTTPGA